MSPERRAYYVNALTRDCIESAKLDVVWLEDIFMNGFPGFENMPDDELEKAYVDAGLDFLEPTQ